MTALNRVLLTPGLVQVDTITIGRPPAAAWDRLRGRATDDLIVRVDDFASSPEHPGFQLLFDEPPREFVVGAIGKVWQPRIPFLHMADATAFAAVDEPGSIKVAWALRIAPVPTGSHIAIEVRVAATDPASWTRFRRYFAFIGPFFRYIRHAMLRQLARDNPPT